MVGSVGEAERCREGRSKQKVKKERRQRKEKGGGDRKTGANRYRVERLVQEF